MSVCLFTLLGLHFFAKNKHPNIYILIFVPILCMLLNWIIKFLLFKSDYPYQIFIPCQSMDADEIKKISESLYVCGKNNFMSSGIYKYYWKQNSNRSSVQFNGQTRNLCM